jgi:hypothetical protein
MILLDTHVLVWSQLEPRKLSRAATSALQRAERGKWRRDLGNQFGGAGKPARSGPGGL